MKVALRRAALLGYILTHGSTLAQELTAQEDLEEDPPQLVPSGCFAQSRFTFGLAKSASYETFSHRDQLSESSFTESTRLTQIKGCYQGGIFTGLRLTLSDPDSPDSDKIRLTDIGDSATSQNCDTIDLSATDYIKQLKIGWDARGVESVAILTKEGTIAIFGESNSQQERFDFDGEKLVLVGLHGQKGSSAIKSMGAIVYRPVFCQDQILIAETSAQTQQTQDGASELNGTDQDSAVDGQSTTEGQQPSIADQIEEKVEFSFLYDFLTDAGEIQDQFSSFAIPERPEPEQEPEDEQGSVSGSQDLSAQDLLAGDTIKAEDESSLVIPIVVGVVFIAILVLTCVICFRLVSRKGSQPTLDDSKLAAKGASKDDESIGVDSDERGQNLDTQPATDRKLLTDQDTNEIGKALHGTISVEEQQEDTSSPERLQSKKGDDEGVSPTGRANLDSQPPEVHHPAVMSALETINELTNEEGRTNPTTNRQSFANNMVGSKSGEEESQPAVFDEESSSMAVINLADTQVPKQQPSNDQGIRNANILPQISQKRAKNLFQDVTPDSRGVPIKRFQEIIDSDDETNGNGTQLLSRAARKKAQGKILDAFGDTATHLVEEKIEEEQTSKSEGINLPEGDGQTQDQEEEAKQDDACQTPEPQSK